MVEVKVWRDIIDGIIIGGKTWMKIANETEENEEV